jgi:hypothetical protein
LQPAAGVAAAQALQRQGRTFDAFVEALGGVGEARQAAQRRQRRLLHARDGAVRAQRRHGRAHALRRHVRQAPLNLIRQVAQRYQPSLLHCRHPKVFSHRSDHLAHPRRRRHAQPRVRLRRHVARQRSALHQRVTAGNAHNCAHVCSVRHRVNNQRARCAGRCGGVVVGVLSSLRGHERQRLEGRCVQIARRETNA